jgi:hypothetical protein
VAVFIGGGILAWNWIDNQFIGDADSRIHLYNSSGGSAVVEIRKPDDRGQPETIHLEKRKGHTLSTRHSGRYMVAVSTSDGKTRELEVEIEPSSVEDSDVLLDVGGREKFHVTPLFYMPVGWTDEQKEYRFSSLARKYKEYTYTSRTKVTLPVRIDYGLDEPAPVSKDIGFRPVRRGGFLRTLIRKVVAGEWRPQENKEAYYVLADGARYQKMLRTLSN